MRIDFKLYSTFGHLMNNLGSSLHKEMLYFQNAQEKNKTN
jgi:hypothetical protein